LHVTSRWLNSEPWLDTSGTNPAGELMFNILASFAQFERSLIGERVRAGMARAKQQGRPIGRPRAVDGEWEEIAPRVWSGELSRRQAAKALGVSRTSIQRYLRGRADR
jgi:DNA invertase Pin-like site-specific DNA recombinase